MQRTRLIIAVLLVIVAAGLLYYQFTSNPWLVGRQSQHASGPPAAAKDTGPTPEQMKKWAQLRNGGGTKPSPKTPAGNHHSTAAAPEGSHHTPGSADRSP